MGAGHPYRLPDGATLRHVREEYVHEAERGAGYRPLYVRCGTDRPDRRPGRRARSRAVGVSETPAAPRRP